MPNKISYRQLLAHPNNYTVNIDKEYDMPDKCRNQIELRGLMSRGSIAPISKRWLVMHSPYADDKSDSYVCAYAGWAKHIKKGGGFEDDDLIIITNDVGFGLETYDMTIYNMFYDNDPGIAKLLFSLLPKGHKAKLPKLPQT